YDDGPWDLTPQYLALLSRYNVKATFFVIGAHVVASQVYKNNLKAAYDAGHQIALHSWSHNHNTAQTTEVLISEIIYSAKAVYDIIGKVPRYYRNPYGDTDDRVRHLIVAMGMRTALWNVVANDTDFFYTIQDATKTYPNGTRYLDTSLWTTLNITERFRNVLQIGYQPGLTPNDPGLVWVPNAPSVIRAGAPPPPPYPGFISLEHELLPLQFEAAEIVLPMVLTGRLPDLALPDLGVVETGTTTTSRAPTSTVAAAPNPPLRTYRPATIAECDGDATKEYLDDSDPLVAFIRDIKLPLSASEVDPSSGGGSSGGGGGASGGGGSATVTTSGGGGSGRTNDAARVGAGMMVGMWVGILGVLVAMAM
ncbi:chitin deacetylase, partial [Dinochytrium kinnereticum]